jgi:hypothetical protein
MLKKGGKSINDDVARKVTMAEGVEKVVMIMKRRKMTKEEKTKK